MAKSVNMDELILSALERAVSDPTPRKLQGTNAKPGIFVGSTAAVKAAAERCLELGLIEMRGEQKAKNKAVSLYGIAPAGVTYLLEQSPAYQALRTAQAGVAGLSDWTAACQRTLSQVVEHLGKLREVVQHAAARVQPPDIKPLLAALQPARTEPAPAAVAAPPAASAGLTPELTNELLRFVQQQKRQAPLRPVELPQLWRFARTRLPALTLGQFHDAVRRLAEARQLRLSPFTQAMYQLAEPECAMIVGREVMYYVESV